MAKNPWPGNFEGLVQMPRLGKQTGPRAGASNGANAILNGGPPSGCAVKPTIFPTITGPANSYFLFVSDYHPGTNTLWVPGNGSISGHIYVYSLSTFTLVHDINIASALGGQNAWQILYDSVNDQMVVIGEGRNSPTTVGLAFINPNDYSHTTTSIPGRGVNFYALTYDYTRGNILYTESDNSDLPANGPYHQVLVSGATKAVLTVALSGTGHRDGLYGGATYCSTTDKFYFGVVGSAVVKQADPLTLASSDTAMSGAAFPEMLRYFPDNNRMVFYDGINPASIFNPQTQALLGTFDNAGLAWSNIQFIGYDPCANQYNIGDFGVLSWFTSGFTFIRDTDLPNNVSAVFIKSQNYLWVTCGSTAGSPTHGFIASY